VKVLISGYYGAGNVGDEALLSGLITGLRARGFEPAVLSADPPATRALHGVAAFDRVKGLIPALLSTRALISGGGGLLQDVTSARSLTYYLTTMRTALRLGKRVVVYGQSLGPLSSAGKDRVARTLRDVPLAVRDAESVAIAKELGLSCVMVADPALLLPVPTDLPPADRAGPVVLVPRGDQDVLNSALEALAVRLAEEEVPLVAAAFHPAQDAGAALSLARLVPGLEVRDASTPEAALRALAGARYVVSVRLHGCILAARLEIGFAGLSYDPKVRGFLAQAAAPSFQRPVDERALLNLVLAGPPVAGHAVAHLTRLADEGIDWLATNLREARPRRPRPG
jgi:polysaccharide pyruvyl transferase CsaB